MPELPEVETVKNRLLPFIKGRTIIKCEIFYSKYDCLKPIVNQKIEGMGRKGKYLIFILSDYYVVSHLRMEGKYFVRDDESLGKHDHVRLTLDDGKHIIYNDVRKFGTFDVFDKKTDIYQVEPLKSVGKEPFEITPEELINSLKSRKEPLKSALLDQTIMSGLGNIYVNEVLYKTKLSPYLEASTITLDDSKNITDASTFILTQAIELGGSTIRSYGSINGESGHAQGLLQVHMREGKRCERCGNIILLDKCGGRGTYFCPTCQRRNRNERLYAITGGFAGGKSTVLKILSKMGYDTYSCDDVYKDLFKNSKEMRREIKKAFGSCELDDLRKTVFADREKNELLKSITHKYVMSKIFETIESKKSDVVFVEVPLLFESNFDKAFDRTICVKRPKEMLEELLQSRGLSMEEYLKRTKTQMPEDEKTSRSDFVIENSGTLSDLRKKTKELLKKLGEK